MSGCNVPRRLCPLPPLRQTDRQLAAHLLDRDGQGHSKPQEVRKVVKTWKDTWAMPTAVTPAAGANPIRWKLLIEDVR